VRGESDSFTASSPCGKCLLAAGSSGAIPPACSDKEPFGKAHKKREVIFSRLAPFLAKRKGAYALLLKKN
jgi:hypothetical protein